MQSNVTRLESKKAPKFKAIRLSLETERKITKHLVVANKKKCGKKIKPDHIIGLALDLITDSHIELLKANSLTNEDRKEQLRQKYIEKHGPISKDQFIGFMLTKEFFEFQNTTV